MQGEKRQQGLLCLLQPCQFFLLTLSVCRASLCSALHPAATAKPNASDTHPLLCPHPKQSTSLRTRFSCTHFVSMSLLGQLSPITARYNRIPPLKSFKSKEVRQTIRGSYRTQKTCLFLNQILNQILNSASHPMRRQ